MRGSLECSEQEGNPAPAKGYNGPPIQDGYVCNALALGWRIGFTAGGDDHSGCWGSEAYFGRYKQGLMSVEAQEKTREAGPGPL